MKRWPTKPLGEIADLFGGSTPSRNNPEFWNGEILWVTPTDLPMSDEGIAVVGSTKDRITQAGLDNSSAIIVPKGTVLFSSRATIGKVAVADTPLTTNQGFANFVPRSEVSSRFLAYSLWHHRDDIARLSGSTTFKEVSRSTFRKYQISVPPLAEQERIVKLLDEADELRKLRAQADRSSAALTPALFHEMFGDPIANPSKWTKATLGKACQKLTDGTHFSPPSVDKGVPYITAKHLRKYGLDFDRDPTYVSLEHHREIYARCDPKPGDVLYIKDGATTGLAAVNNYKFEFSMLSSLALMRPNPAKCKSEFLCAWLNDSAVKASMLDQMAGAAIRRLTLVKLKNAPILLPPLSLQKQFTHRVSEIRELEAAQAASRQRVEHLFQSMLHRAFNQEL